MSEPTTFELERMALGEIPTPPEHAEAVAELRASNDEILEQYPAEEFAPVEPSASRYGRTPGAVWASGGTLLAAAAAVLILLGPPQQPSDRKRPIVPANDGEIRLKGPDARLQVWIATEDGQKLLDPGASVGAGDVVQPKFGVSEPGFGLVFSVDGRGSMTVIHPEGESKAVEIEPGKLRPANFSMELDDAPDFERFHFVVCDEAFEAAPMVEQIMAGEDPPAESCTLKTVELDKR